MKNCIEKCKSPFVSVVIPASNCGEMLKKCLRSLSNQDYRGDRYEIIVVANGTDKREFEYLKEEKQYRIIYLEKEMEGSYAARNKGISFARGEIIGFTDGDCVADKCWIKNAAEYFERGEIGMLGGRIEFLFKGKNRLNQFELYDTTFGFKQEKNVKKRKISVCANLFVRKNIFNETGLFNAKLLSGGDIEFCKRAVKSGYEIIYAEDVLIRHPARSSRIMLQEKAKRVMNGLYMFDKRFFLVKMTLSPFIRATKVLTDRRLGFFQKVSVFFVVCIVFAAQFSEGVALIFCDRKRRFIGSESPRKANNTGEEI